MYIFYDITFFIFLWKEWTLIKQKELMYTYKIKTAEVFVTHQIMSATKKHFYKISEADASDYLENLKEMLHWYHTISDA